MLNFLMPDFYFHTIYDVPVSFYKENNIKGVLFDIDNTLEPYQTEIPGKKAIELFDTLKSNDIKVAIVSNNHEERVKKFSEPLGVYYSFESGKPSSKKINELINKLELDKSEVVIVGDQIFTDVWAANNSKIKGILVDKINSNESFFIKVKRVLEIPLFKKIQKKGYGKIR